ncbi:MAG: hypothetical protein ACSLEY_03155 [Candidatus Saccharimonadales bacterium]
MRQVLYAAPRGRVFGLGFLLATLAGIAVVSSASAFNNSYPDANDTSGAANVYQLNQQSQYVQQSMSKVRIWFPSNSGKLKIANGHYCLSNPGDYLETEDGTYESYRNEGRVTEFNPSTGSTKYGQKFANSDNRCNNDIDMAFNNITTKENGWYYVDITVKYVADHNGSDYKGATINTNGSDRNPGWDGGANAFKFVASSDARVGLPGDTSGHATTQEQANSSPTYTNYYAAFGTPCSTTTSQTAQVTLYDLDNAGGGGAQPVSGSPVTVRVKNVTANSYVNFNGGVGTTWTPADTQNSSQSITFTAMPNNKYRLELLNVYYNNTIQYSVPYSQINSLVCPPVVNWTISPSTTINGGTVASNNNRYVRPGDTIKWQHGAKNTGTTNIDQTVIVRAQQKVHKNSTWSTWSNISLAVDPGYWIKAPGSWAGGTSLNQQPTTWTPVNGDSGKKVCRRTLANATSQDSNADAVSDSKCAVAYQQWTLEPITAQPAFTCSGNGCYPTPGDTVTWSHKVKNKGPDRVSLNSIGYTVTRTRERPLGTVVLSLDSTSGSFTSTWNANKVKSIADRTYTVHAQDVGSYLCETISVSPRSHGTTLPPTIDASPASLKRCIQVPYNYTLTPQVTINPVDIAEGDQPIDVQPSISNTGPTQSADTDWRLTRLVYSPGVTPVLGLGHSIDGPCAYYTSASSCDQTFGSGENAVVPNSGLNLGSFTSSVGGLEVGSKLCFGLSIKPWSNVPGGSGGDDWRHSSLACVTVAKRPKLQVHGGDVSVHDGGIITSLSQYGTGVTAKTYGSWVEYGAISPDANQTFASGAGLRDGHTNPAAVPAPWSQLTFANVRVTGATKSVALGGYHLGTWGGTLAAQFRTLQAETATTGTSLQLERLMLRDVRSLDYGASDVLISGIDGIAGTYIIRTAGDARITQNIELDYELTLASPRDIPQVVIVARNITIDAGVTRVDAWLVADESVDTCTNAPAQLAISDCASPLTVNGVVQTKRLHLHRTAGGGSDTPALPAETFMLPGYAYLWFQQLQSKPEFVTSSYIVEKPPRF